MKCQFVSILFSETISFPDYLLDDCLQFQSQDSSADWILKWGKVQQRNEICTRFVGLIKRLPQLNASCSIIESLVQVGKKV